MVSTASVATSAVRVFWSPILAKEEVSVPPVTPSAWRKQPPTWSGISSRRRRPVGQWVITLPKRMRYFLLQYP